MTLPTVKLTTEELASFAKEAEQLLTSAVRQYKTIDSNSTVFAFNTEDTMVVVIKLLREIKKGK